MSAGRSKDMTGRRIGSWTVVGQAPSVVYQNGRSYKATWNCLCVCGVTRVVTGDRLRRGTSKSCGHKKDKPEYGVWDGMKQRCNNPNNDRYKDYGGRGIKICKRWLSYDNFIKDMGVRPDSTYSINRIDNNKGYSPANCEWATREQQQSNTRSNVFYIYGGLRLTHSQWARRLGISTPTLYKRLRNWPTKRVFTQINVKGECG